MTEKIDIAEILKDKPENTKLYSPLFGEVYFSHVGGGNIAVEHHGGISLFFSSGRFFDLDESEPLLFPSKEMRNWSKFAWKKGDVLYSAGLKEYCVFNKFISDGYLMFISKYNVDENTKRVVPKTYDPDKNTVNYEKVSDEKATEIISLIEEHYGGKLNLSTLEIEKQSEFKDGDIVVTDAVPSLCYSKCILILKGDLNTNENSANSYVFYNINNNRISFDVLDTTIRDRNIHLATDSEKQQLFDALEKEGKAWDAEKKQIVDLKPKCEFKPFDKVLSRRCSEDYWVLNFYSHKTDYYHICIDGSSNLYCIPYNEETAHLRGTTDDWEGGEQ